MNPEDERTTIFRLPDDLAQAIAEFSEAYNESPRDIVIAAVEHFTRISEQQRRAVIRGTAGRRRS